MALPLFAVDAFACFSWELFGKWRKTVARFQANQSPPVRSSGKGIRFSFPLPGSVPPVRKLSAGLLIPDGGDAIATSTAPHRWGEASLPSRGSPLANAWQNSLDFANVWQTARPTFWICQCLANSGHFCQTLAKRKKRAAFAARPSALLAFYFFPSCLAAAAAAAFARFRRIHASCAIISTWFVVQYSDRPDGNA